MQRIAAQRVQSTGYPTRNGWVVSGSFFYQGRIPARGDTGWFRQMPTQGGLAGPSAANDVRYNARTNGGGEPESCLSDLALVPHLEWR